LPKSHSNENKARYLQLVEYDASTLTLLFERVRVSACGHACACACARQGKVSQVAKTKAASDDESLPL
jgi:hypothetical protein